MLAAAQRKGRVEESLPTLVTTITEFQSALVWPSANTEDTHEVINIIADTRQESCCSLEGKILQFQDYVYLVWAYPRNFEST